MLTAYRSPAWTVSVDCAPCLKAVNSPATGNIVIQNTELKDGTGRSKTLLYLASQITTLIRVRTVRRIGYPPLGRHFGRRFTFFYKTPLRLAIVGRAHEQAYLQFVPAAALLRQLEDTMGEGFVITAPSLLAVGSWNMDNAML